MKKLALHWKILIAIGFAVVFGSLFDAERTWLLGASLNDLYSFVGTLFLNALKMIVVPLVVSSIICGVASIGSDESALGRLGFKTLGFYTASSLLAILIGLAFVNITNPGIIDGAPAGESLHLQVDETDLGAQMQRVEGRGMGDIADVFLRMVPPNIVSAAANGQMLGLIFFSVLFGLFMIKADSVHAQTMLSFWQGVNQTMLKMTMWVMSFAPYGVFALVAKTIAATGFDAFVPMLIFFITVMAALMFHLFITMSVMLKFVAKVSPVRHFHAMTPALLTAFSTASSASTLPLTMDCVEKRAGVSQKSSSFVLPLGATINMDGTALYECVAAMFIAQAYGIDLSLSTQFMIVVIALLTSIGVAGIPAASLVAISVILIAIGLPVEAIGLLLVTDRILDMVRTAVNVYSDSCCAVFVASSEGEIVLDKPVAQMPS